MLPQFDRLDGKTTLAREAFRPFREELQKISSRLQRAAEWLNR